MTNAVMMASVMHMMIMPVLSPAMGDLVRFGSLRIRQDEEAESEERQNSQ
jgi:hypothetical protein